MMARTSRLITLVLLGVLMALVMAACGGSSSGGDSSGDSSGDVTTSAAEACPPKVEGLDVTSTELNLFVWTEYIPQEMLDCFEDVYGVRINRNEYSSNEEMYAKILVGTNTSYDLIQPTDQIVGLMARAGLVETLDHAKLPVLENFDAASARPGL